MLTIQTAGQQILNNNPGKFYVFCGLEYGVKDRYLTAIKSHYNGVYTEYSNFKDVRDLMQVKSIIPLKPQLYIIRYDDEFLNSLKDRTASDINKLNIIGTVVIIYQDTKSLTKCDKFLPDYTISFNLVASHYLIKYLVNDYPDLDKNLVNLAIKSRIDYKGAQILSSLFNMIPKSDLSIYDDSQIASLFYCSNESLEDNIKIGFASRNFHYLIQVIDDYPGDLDFILYMMLNTLVELDKLKVKNYIESPLKPYLNVWTKQDIYNMYMIIYQTIEDLRSITTDTYARLVYVLGILQYNPIPILELMDWGL